MTTIVTTGGRPDENSHQRALFASEALQIEFVERKKRSIKKLMAAYHADVLVAGKDRYELHSINSETPFFFHPSSAAFRAKRVMRGENDPFLKAVNLTEGQTMIDCTLGMATDSMMAAIAVGDTGKIIGCEGNPIIAFIMKEGLQSYDFVAEKLMALHVMRNIEVISSVAVDYLKTLPSNCVDVVYLDPMFEETIEESTNFAPLRKAGVHISLDEQWLKEAYRVCKKRVVLKARHDSPLFEKYSFIREIRPNIKFHYGILEKEA